MKGVTGYLAFRDRMAKSGLMPPVPEEHKQNLRSREDRDWNGRYNRTRNVRQIFEDYHQTMMAKFGIAPVSKEQASHRIIASARIHELRFGEPSHDKEE